MFIHTKENEKPNVEKVVKMSLKVLMLRGETANHVNFIHANLALWKTMNFLSKPLTSRIWFELGVFMIYSPVGQFDPVFR